MRFVFCVAGAVVRTAVFCNLVFVAQPGSPHVHVEFHLLGLSFAVFLARLGSRGFGTIVFAVCSSRAVVREVCFSLTKLCF